MPTCIRCGRSVEGYSAEGLCDSCAAASGIGTPAEVPCQRCGMYLPPHELRMWNSRLYCAYCIMDIQDDERRAKGGKKPEGRVEQEGGSLFSGLFGGKGDGKGAGKPGEARYQQYSHAQPGTCDRCGRESYVLYFVQGRKLCPSCIDSGSASGAGPSFLAQIVSSVKRAAGIKQQPKIIPNEQQKEVFDIRSRKMVEKIESPPKPPAEIFSVQARKFEDKKEGIEAAQLMDESARAEKKPQPKKVKKLFFKMHPSSGGAVKKK